MRKTNKSTPVHPPKRSGDASRPTGLLASRIGGLWFIGALLLALMLCFIVFTAKQFPYTYITMEGDDFWVLTRDYWRLKLALLPAATNWLADWLIQFHRSPFTAATIHATVLSLTGLTAASVIRRETPHKWLGLIALLPTILLACYSTFNLSFLLQCLFLCIGLLVYQQNTSFRGKLACSILSVGLGFFLMRTPLLLLMLLLEAIIALKHHGWKQSVSLVMPLLLLAVTPLVYSQQLAFIPFAERYWSLGTEFHAPTSRHITDAEYVKKCVKLADEGRWEELLYKEKIRTDAQKGLAVSLRYALLCESALGTLPDNLTLYPIRKEEQFLFPHEGGVVKTQFNRLFYLNLGIYDEAFHQAEEYGLLMPGGNCFSSLRQMADYSLKAGDAEIAEKYLDILAKSTCHKAFVRERREALQKLKNTPTAGEEAIPLRADNFVGGYPLPIEMLRLARYFESRGTPSDPNHAARIRKMLDYAICSYMLRGDINSFRIVLTAFGIYKTDTLPKAYRQFLEEHSGRQP